MLASPKRAMRGMTLIELMVALVIMVMLMLGVGPSISAWMRNTQVRNVASSMLAGLSRARNEAMRRNVPVRFSLVNDSTVLSPACALSASGVSWVVSVRDPTANCQRPPVALPGTSTDPGLIALYNAAVADATDPMIVEANAGGVGGTNVVVAAKAGDGTAVNTVTFNSFGRVIDLTPIAAADVRNNVAGGDFRRLRIEIGVGGTVRMCDYDVVAATDSRHCTTTGAIP